MPSPLIHLSAAAALACRTSGQNSTPLWRIMAAAAFFSMLPDLDFLPGLIMRNAQAYHNQASHSLLAGLAACLAGTFATKPFLPALSMRQTAALLTSCYGSHLLLDWLTFGRGLKLLWPVMDTRFASPFPVFYGVRHSEGLLSSSHLITLFSELAFLAAVYLMYKVGAGKSKRLDHN